MNRQLGSVTARVKYEREDGKDQYLVCTMHDVPLVKMLFHVQHLDADKVVFRRPNAIDIVPERFANDRTLRQ
jgi:hypothetical protein